MTKFKYSIVMPCNNEQEKEITPELKRIGYNIRINATPIEAVVTYNGNINSTVYRGSFSKDWGGREVAGPDHVVLEEYNKELFLALAAVTTLEEFSIGEYITTDKSSHGEIKMSKLHKIIGFSLTDRWLQFDEFRYGNNKDYNSHKPEDVRKANKQEIIQHFGNYRELGSIKI